MADNMPDEGRRERLRAWLAGEVEGSHWMPEAERVRRAVLLELGETGPPLFLVREDRSWTGPQPTPRPAPLREYLESLPGALFKVGAVFVSEAAERHVAAKGGSPREVLARHARGEWEALTRNQAKENSTSLGGEDVAPFPGAPSDLRAVAVGGFLGATFEDPRKALAAYTEPGRTFTCLALAPEAPWTPWDATGARRPPAYRVPLSARARHSTRRPCRARGGGGPIVRAIHPVCAEALPRLGRRQGEQERHHELR
jgi:hypothetical protein